MLEAACPHEVLIFTPSPYCSLLHRDRTLRLALEDADALTKSGSSREGKLGAAHVCDIKLVGRLAGSLG